MQIESAAFLFGRCRLERKQQRGAQDSIKVLFEPARLSHYIQKNSNTLSRISRFKFRETSPVLDNQAATLTSLSLVRSRKKEKLGKSLFHLA
jgi:hypothetical protein